MRHPELNSVLCDMCMNMYRVVDIRDVIKLRVIDQDLIEVIWVPSRPNMVVGAKDPSIGALSFWFVDDEALVWAGNKDSSGDVLFHKVHNWQQTLAEYYDSGKISEPVVTQEVIAEPLSLNPEQQEKFDLFVNSIKL